MRNLIWGSITLLFAFAVYSFLRHAAFKIAPLISVSPENIGLGVLFLIIAYGVGIVVTDFIDG